MAPLYVVVPDGRLMIEGPESVTFEPASTEAVMPVRSSGRLGGMRGQQRGSVSREQGRHRDADFAAESGAESGMRCGI